jgi:hypothetical protein
MADLIDRHAFLESLDKVWVSLDADRGAAVDIARKFRLTPPGHRISSLRNRMSV